MESLLLDHKLPKQDVEFTSLVELVQWRASCQPDCIAFTFLTDDDTDLEHITYKDLDVHARAIATFIQGIDAQKERAMLLFPPGLQYISAFFGCLYAGITAVPAYPPKHNKHYNARLRTLATKASTSVVLTTQHIKSSIDLGSTYNPLHQSVRWVSTDNIDKDLSGKWIEPTLNHASTAFIQYTSGSTSAPKGVLLTHGNLLSNLAAIQVSFRHSPDSRGVIWLPPYHDMGLIGGILQPLYAGFPVTLMSPMTFLQSPLKWLKTISRTNATTSGGPNFAYQLCIDKISDEQRATLDLSSWIVAFNGAESINAETIDRFADTFAPCGFKKESFVTCYGLAEATLLVASKTNGIKSKVVSETVKREPNSGNREFEVDSASKAVSCGEVIAGHKVAIIDPVKGTACSANEVGEIWLTGPSVSLGYFDEGTEAGDVFDAYLNDNDKEPYLKTGDLGFLSDGELFVVGRLKDLIVIRGKNFYPQDIERTVERSHEALRLGYNAAFSITEGVGERLVVAQEIKRTYLANLDIDTVITAVRSETLKHHGLTVDTIVLLKPGSISKTSSGKTQRHICRNQFLAGELNIVGTSHVSSAKPIEGDHFVGYDELATLSKENLILLIGNYVKAILSSVLGISIPSLSKQSMLNTLGIDSLTALELQHRIESDLKVHIPMVRFLQQRRLSQLIDELIQALYSPPSSPIDNQVSVVEKGIPLSFAQQDFLVADQLLDSTPAHNIPILVHFNGELVWDILKLSFEDIIDRHKIFESKFLVSNGQLLQIAVSDRKVVMSHIDLMSLTPSQQNDEVGRLVKQENNRAFNLSSEPLLRIMLLQIEPQQYFLLLNFHHIICDGWSTNILIHELTTLYSSKLQGSSPCLPKLRIQYSDFVAWQHHAIESGLFDSQLKYWWKKLVNPPLLMLPQLESRMEAPHFQGCNVPVFFSVDLVAKLKNICVLEGSTLFMLLLSAFSIVISRYSNQEDIIIGTDVSGRDSVGTAPLIGCFVNQVAIRLNILDESSFRALLKDVRETTLEALSNQDIPFTKVVRGLGLKRKAKHSPLLQFKLTLHNVSDEALCLPNLAATIIETSNDSAQLDLTVKLRESSEGIKGDFNFDAGSFRRDVIGDMARDMGTILEYVTISIDVSVGDLKKANVISQKGRKKMSKNEKKLKNFKKFLEAEDRFDKTAHKNVIEMSYLEGNNSKVPVVQAREESLDLSSWVLHNASVIEKKILQYGAVLFKGFDVYSIDEFEKFSLTVCSKLYKDNSEHVPVGESQHVQTPVPYSPNMKLLWHNENSFNNTWPTKIIFGCSQPAHSGGETLLVDSRKVLTKLSSDTKRQFIAKGVSYVRSYGSGLGLDWQTVFRTSSQAEVEEVCRNASIALQWEGKANLKTTAVRRAVEQHPKTGDLVWFNQAQHWHVACLDLQTRTSLSTLFNDDDFPRNAYFGDGSRIPDAMMEEILEVYESLEVSIALQKGDVMLVDNMLTAHGRNAFTGQRKILVALGDMVSHGTQSDWSTL